MRKTEAMLVLTLLITSAGCSAHKGDYHTRDVVTKAKVEDLVKRIDVDPDMLHGDYTPAVRELTKIGMPSLQYGVLELLLSTNEMTRSRAENVLLDVTAIDSGWTPGTADEGPAYQRWLQLLKQNGSYRFDGPEDERRSSYSNWVRWVQERSKQ
jgi:hypothetical protein